MGYIFPIVSLCKRMKYMFLFLCLPFLALSQNWQEFQSDSMNFKVHSPYPLVHKSNQAMTDFGTLTVESFGIQAPKRDKNYLYQIIIVPYPKGTLPTDSLDLQKDVIQGFIDASHVEDPADKIYQTSITNNGQSYEQWVIHHAEEYSIKSKATIRDDKLYVIQVMTLFANSVNTDIDKFLDSFRFLE